MSERRAERGARWGPASRRVPGPGCVCAPLAACRTLPLPARLRLKRPSDARSAERGECLRATRGARSEVGSCLAPRSRPWLRLCAAGCLLYAATAGPAAFQAPERRAERGARSEVECLRATRGARSEVGGLSRAAMPDLGCVCAAGIRTLPLPSRLRLKRPSDARGAR